MWTDLIGCTVLMTSAHVNEADKASREGMQCSFSHHGTPVDRLFTEEEVCQARIWYIHGLAVAQGACNPLLVGV